MNAATPVGKNLWSIVLTVVSLVCLHGAAGAQTQLTGTIRGQVLDHFEQLRAVIGLTDDRIARQIHYQGAHASPDQRVVIHQ